MRLFIALDNIRSAHNVGAILRTAYGFELDGVVSIGVTPHMQTPDDDRLPHVVSRAEKHISKTALGGEVIMKEHFSTHQDFLRWVTGADLELISLELTATSEEISQHQSRSDTVLVLGNEVDGVSKPILEESRTTLHIPISPNKESYNVASAGAMAMYALHAQFGKL